MVKQGHPGPRGRQAARARQAARVKQVAGAKRLAAVQGSTLPKGPTFPKGSPPRGPAQAKGTAGPPPSVSRERAATAAVWLLVLASVALLPEAFVRWFLPKDAIAAVAVVAASVAVARGRLPRWFVLASAAAAALAVVSVLLSAAPAVQLWGRWPRYEGLVALPVYFGAVWAGARLLGPSAPGGKLRAVVRAVAVAAMALGIVSLLEAVGARPFASDLARPGSLTGNATDQGLLGALFLAVLALPVLRAWTGLTRSPGSSSSTSSTGSPRAKADVVPPSRAERGALTAGLGLAAASVILSASRAGLLAAAIVLAVLVTLELVRVRGVARRTLAIGSGSALLLAAAALAMPFTRDRLLGLSPLSASSLEGRFTFWNDSIAILVAHPLGVGVSGFLNANAAASTGDGTLDSPHNWLFQVAMAGGVPLTVIVAGIAVAVAGTGVRAWRRAGIGDSSLPHTLVAAESDCARTDLLAGALAALAGYAVALLTHFTAPSTMIVAAVLVGFLLAAAPTSSASAAPRANARDTWAKRLAAVRTGLLVVSALAVVGVACAEIPLGAGVAAAGRGDIAAAESSFAAAQSLRPWDADLSSIAAQSFAAAADAGVADAATHAVDWAQRSRATLPGTIATERALAIGQLHSGDASGAGVTLAALIEIAPNDGAVALQNAIVLYTLGDVGGAGDEVDRALVLDPTDETALRIRKALAAE